MNTRAELVGHARRVVVKFGTGLLTNTANRLALDQIERLAAQIATLHHQGRELILVSSGAIAAGMAQLGLATRPRALAELQACAAIGQSKLMSLYDEAFAKFDVQVAQVLLTHDDLRNRARHLNARNTLQELLRRRVLPIINENDTVAVEEIKFGDNDRLGALTAALLDADLLIILSHVEGLLDGQRQVLAVVETITPAIQQLAGGTDRATSVGGMASKIEAARIVTRAGAPLIIASGERDNILAELLAGHEHGTIFLPRTPKLPGRKRWIAFFQRVAGAVTVDDGARAALCEHGKSLLAKGVRAVEGEFMAGALVSIRDKNGIEFARGLAKVASADLNQTADVVAHRDDLVIL